MKKPDEISAEQWERLLAASMTDQYAHAVLAYLQAGRPIADALAEVLLACALDRTRLAQAYAGLMERTSIPSIVVPR